MATLAASVARRAVDAALVLLVALVLGSFVLARIVPALLGGSTFVVGGASMEPAIPLGSAVLVLPVDAAQIREGDVVSLRAEEASPVVTHRVVSIGDDGTDVLVKTQGDASLTPDPSLVPAGRVIGRVALALPLAGFLVAMLGSVGGVVTVTSLALLLVGVAWLLRSDEPGPRSRPSVAHRRAGPVPGWLVRRTAALVAMLAIVLPGVAAAVPVTGALFAAGGSVTGDASTGRIFPGHRVTPAFTIADSSSGTTVDGSSPIAYPGDSRWSVVHPWPAAFDTSRRLELALNHPLPAGLDVSSVELAVTLASDDPGGTACWYAELVRTSDGSVVSTHGTAASPLACVGGSTFVRTVVPLAAVTGSDLANDLTVRLHGRSSTGGAARIDEVTVTGATPYAAFTLYAVRTRDAGDGGVETAPWQLAGE